MAKKRASRKRSETSRHRAAKPQEDGNRTEKIGDEEKTADEVLYVRGVLIRGEAARAKDGELPPGATHEIVEEPEDDLPVIQRRRFSAF